MESSRLLGGIIALEVDELRKSVQSTSSFVCIGAVLNQVGDAFVDVDVVGGKL